MGLLRCPVCQRHIRRTERECPFCGTIVPAAITERRDRSMPVARLGRAALFTFAAATVGSAGCSSTHLRSTGRGDPPEESGGAGGQGGSIPQSVGGSGGAGAVGWSMGGLYGSPPPRSWANGGSG